MPDAGFFFRGAAFLRAGEAVFAVRARARTVAAGAAAGGVAAPVMMMPLTVPTCPMLPVTTMSKPL